MSVSDKYAKFEKKLERWGVEIPPWGVSQPESLRMLVDKAKKSGIELERVRIPSSLMVKTNYISALLENGFSFSNCDEEFRKEVLLLDVGMEIHSLLSQLGVPDVGLEDMSVFAKLCFDKKKWNVVSYMNSNDGMREKFLRNNIIVSILALSNTSAKIGSDSPAGKAIDIILAENCDDAFDSCLNGIKGSPYFEKEQRELWVSELLERRIYIKMMMDSKEVIKKTKPGMGGRF